MPFLLFVCYKDTSHQILLHATAHYTFKLQSLALKLSPLWVGSAEVINPVLCGSNGTYALPAKTGKMSPTHHLVCCYITWRNIIALQKQQKQCRVIHNNKYKDLIVHHLIEAPLKNKVLDYVDRKVSPAVHVSINWISVSNHKLSTSADYQICSTEHVIEGTSDF